MSAFGKINKHPIFILSASLGSVLASGLIGHFLPIGLVLSLFSPPLATGIMLNGLPGINPLWKGLLTFLLVGLHDVGQRFYGYGTLDHEGLDLFNSFLFFGLIPTFGLLLISIIVPEKKVTTIMKFAGIAIFLVMISAYLHFFGDLGVETT